MFILKDYVYLDINVNGQRLPFTPDMIEKITITQNVIQTVPVLTMQIRDPSSILSGDFSLTEGSIISITMGVRTEDEEMEAVEFRVLSTPRTRWHSTGMVQTIKAVFNKVKLFSVASKSYKGNSSDVISKIAKEIGFKPIVDPSSDSMVWIPIHMKNSHFLKYICDHGWADDSSIYVMATRENGELRYANIDRLVDSNPKGLFYYSGERPRNGQFQILQHSVKSASGAINLLHNYGARVVGDALTNEESYEVDQFQAKKFSPFIDMSPKMKEEVGQASSRFYDVNTGNVHKNFAKAEYQNKRGRDLYSSITEVLVGQNTGVQLLDLVEVRLTRPARGMNDEMYSGKYVVTGKTRVLTGNTYGEKFELSAQGRGANPQGDLL